MGIATDLDGLIATCYEEEGREGFTDLQPTELKVTLREPHSDSQVTGITCACHGVLTLSKGGLPWVGPLALERRMWSSDVRDSEKEALLSSWPQASLMNSKVSRAKVLLISTRRWEWNPDLRWDVGSAHLHHSTVGH